jgi:hypothetical protein
MLWIFSILRGRYVTKRIHQSLLQAITATIFFENELVVALYGVLYGNNATRLMYRFDVCAGQLEMGSRVL